MAASAPDLTLLNELYEEIERNPPAFEARKLLIRQCYEAGWIDAARDALRELRTLEPSALEKESWTNTLLEPATTSSTVEEESRIKTLLEPPTKKAPPTQAKKTIPKAPTSPAELEAQKLELVRGYEELRLRAKNMLHETRLLRNLSNDSAKNGDLKLASTAKVRDQDLEALINGRIHSILTAKQLSSARSTVRKIEQQPDKAVELAISDLEDVAKRLRSPSGDDDAVREALLKRTQTISAALPNAMKKHASTAFMHIEHEVLGRKYHCEETMYGDPVADIPRAKFLVTDDGYPWDMEELAEAIKSNGGIMRNPLSKQMFTTDDVHAILQHPLGQCLAALQIEQSKLSLGIRPKTIEELDNMAKILLADMSEDQLKSREVFDAFMAYLATLPETEQDALDKLRVPAVDSHTGIPFDTSIGEAVRDAQGNKLCFHKCADLLSQAVSHLRKSGKFK